MILGDSPQAMVGNLSEADSATYFANRQSLGFNSAWISILCDPYISCSSTGTTVDGIPAFTTPGNLATPNPAYFQRVDDMINLAAQYGITVFLDPIETGGWLNTLESNGLTADYNFGLYLGNRYKNFPNIVWLNGNDFQSWQSSPNDDADVAAVAKGIQAADPNHIQTVELNYQLSSSLDDPNWAAIVGLNAAYTYFPTYAEMYHAYNQSSSVPAFLVEEHYEGENVGGELGTPLVLRRQEYWTMLSGGAGQLYGDVYTWQFLPGWQSNLNTTGTTQLGYFQNLFKPLAWYNMVPDQSNTLVTAGFGTFSRSGLVSANNYVTGAMTLDGSLAMAYVPAAQTITINMAKLVGPVTAQWFDPTSGAYTTVTGSPFTNGGNRQFTPSPTNSVGDNDWVLLLTASMPPDTQPPTIPGGLVATAISPSQIILSWSGSTDNVAVTGYQVFRNGLQVSTTTATNYSDAGLNSNTTYTYTVTAFDDAGNTSAQSVQANATTLIPDTTPPTVPTNLQSSNITSTSATISWASSADNVAVAGYQIYRNGSLLNTTSQTFYNDNALSASTTYNYTVTAYDTSGNISAPSQPLAVTTTVHTATPTFAQGNYAAPQTSQSTVSVTYTNSQVAGDTNIVVIGWSDTTASITSVTDSSGNTYQVAIPTATSRLTPESQAVYYASNINPALGNVVTVKFSRSASFVDLRIAEYSGLSPTNPFDVGSTATGSGGTANSNAITTSFNNDLIIGVGITEGTFNGPGSGYTLRMITSPDADILEDQVGTLAGTYNATASVNNYWLMQIAAFKAAPAQ
jgi:chitodextrinase